MTVEKTIPVLRIFDYAKAVEFYGSYEVAVTDPFGNRLSFNETKLALPEEE